MKRLLFVLIAGVSFTVANAQGSVQFGVKGGLNIANMNVSNGFNGYSYSTLANFNLGVFLKIPVVRYFSFQPELYYSGQGFKVDDGNGGTTTEHVNYLNIPVLAKFTFPVGFFLETGPQLGFKLNAKDKYSDGTTQDVSSYYNSADFSWVIGAGYKIPMAPVAIDLRYNFGVTNVANDAQYGTGYGQYGVRNGVFQLDLLFTLFKTPRR